MAQKAKKDRAKYNASTLMTLHILSLIFNGLFITLSLVFFKRSLITYIVLSIPAYVCEFILERSGRPSHSPAGQLQSSGEDLAAQGLTEYMFDIIWVTWACLVAVTVFGNYAWLLWAVIPGFGMYKGVGILGLARGLKGNNQSNLQAPSEKQGPPSNRKQRRMAA